MTKILDKIKFDQIISFIMKHKYFLLLVLLVIIFYGSIGIPEMLKNPPLSADVYRDITYAQNVLNGNSIFADPSIKGEFIWYPPLNALIMAGISKITGLSLFTLYNYSLLYINIFIPFLFYIFISLVIDKKHAFYATLCIPVMPWLSSHVFQGTMPSIHAFTFILLTLVLFIKFEKKGFDIKRASIIGGLMGMCLLMHSISGLILYGSLGIYLLLAILIFKQKFKLIPLLILVLLPILLWSPYFIPNLLRPKLNTIPFTFFSSALTNPKWTLYLPNEFQCVLFWIFTGTGLVLLIKKINQKEILLLFCLLAITLIGQIFGYLKNWGMSITGFFSFLRYLPSLITHEFQWFFQLFLLPFSAYGFLTLLKKCIKVKYKWMYGIIFTLFLIPAYVEFILENTSWKHDYGTYNPSPHIVWVRENTDKNSVFLVSNVFQNYFELQPYTARKIIYHKSEYMNFNVDVTERENDKSIMLSQASLSRFKMLAKKYDLEYAIIQQNDLPARRINFFRKKFKVVYTTNDFFIIQVKQQETK